MKIQQKLEIADKGFKWLRGTVKLYARAKIDGDTKLVEHIENEMLLMEQVVKTVLNDQI